MNYDQTLEYLLEHLPMFQKIGSAAYRTGLDNTLKLDEWFGHPHENFPCIHVAGTNGKGSVSHTLASVFQEAGYKTGLYTSPHLLDFRERIKLNGKVINREYISEFVEENKPFFDSFQPSFFEISLFLAFTWFEKNDVDVAVIEVGLGGRLDATNIIRPALSVITNIGKDHTEILGDTLEKIAGEKAGIIKPKVPVVIGETLPETLPVFLRRAEEVKASVTLAQEQFRIESSRQSEDGYQVFEIKKNGETVWPDLKCGLLGHYQRKNMVTVLAAIEQLNQKDFTIKEKAVYAGVKNVIKNTGLAGRWQVLAQHPLTVADTAHNTEGLSQVVQQIAETPHGKLRMIIGFVNDKDVESMLSLLPENADLYFCRLSVPRTMDENMLAEKAAGMGIKGRIFHSVKDAYESLKAVAGKDDLVVITGSTFLVADVLRIV